METAYFEITDGSVNVGVTVTELPDGSLRFEILVLDDSGVIGDLNGLFFDLADDTKVDILEASGSDLTGEKFDANSVTKVDSYNNVNGEVVKEDGRFDVGIQFGTQGIGEDDIQSTSFVLATSDGSVLTLNDILHQDFAVRLTSVGEIDGARDGSVKISGTSDPIPVIDDPDGGGDTTDGTGDDGPVDPQNIANDDSMTVSNTETFNDSGMSDPLDGFQFSLLDNDTDADGNAYFGAITEVNDTYAAPGTIYVGSNGGLLLVNEDGTVDFSANDQFGFLSGEETATTQFNYAIEGGDTAVLNVEIFAGDGGDWDISL